MYRKAPLPFSTCNPTQTHTRDTVDFKELHVFGQLSELDLDKTTGTDEMDSRLIRELTAFAANPLSICFNLSKTQSRLPDDWKDAIVSSVFQTGARHKLENYRFVSLTRVIIKILKKTVHS